MIKAKPSEMEKSYRGFRIHIESNEACPYHPFAVEWEDGLETYHPTPAPMRFETAADAFNVACDLIDVQYEMEAQSADQYFNTGGHSPGERR